MKNRAEYIGPNFTFVGYGDTSPYTDSNGSRMEVSMPIQAVGPAEVGGAVGTLNDTLFYYWTPGKSPCGDQGGPAFLVRNGVEHVAGVISKATTSRCEGDGVSARTDQPEIDDFLQAAIDDLEAGDPCRADGVCDDSCNTDQIVDPDCAERHCGRDGVCALACVDPPDPDCAELSGEESGGGGCVLAPGSSRIAAGIVLVLALAATRVRRRPRR
jgi:hypothetical protein